MQVSVVIPAYNEEENIAILHKALTKVLSKTRKSYELIFVDDGSFDNTFKILNKIAKKDKHVKVIKFRRNFGQTPAWSAGFDHAKGDAIVTIDSDLQNDPRDIPRLLAKLDEGYDIVSGWRVKRKDRFFKRFFSVFARKLREKFLSDPTHDFGCSLKAYTNKAAKSLRLFGEMHRYVTSQLVQQGFKITEIRIRHHPRKYGKTKYGLKRLFKGFVDMLYVRFWQDYSTKPMHFFGLLGFLQFGLAFLILIEQIIKALRIGELTLGPLLLLCVLLVVTGTLFLMFGFLAEIMIRMYYADKKIYDIERIVG